MKMYKYILFAATVIMAFACTKEIAPECDQNPVADLVPMTFTTVADTEEETLPSDSKVFYDAQTKTTQWKVGDPVKIVASNGNAYDFSVTEVNENGTSAIIKGEVNKSDEESETFYAVYPASAFKGSDLAAPTNETKGARLYIDVPAVQTAVAGTFDPKAFVSISKSNGNVLEFKNLCSVISFKFNNATDVKSVRFTMNGNTNLAGCENVYISNLSSHVWDDTFTGRSSSNMITLNAPAGGFESDTDYYFTLRPFTQSGDTKGFSFYVEYSDHYKVRSNNSLNLIAKRNGIKGLGALDVEGKIAYLPFFDAYNMGFDIRIGGKVLNKTDNVNATLVTATGANTSLYNQFNNGGIYFLATTESGSFNLHSTVAVTKDVYLIGNNPSAKVVIDMNGKNLYHKAKTVALKNLELDTDAYTNYVFSNNEATADADAFILDNCSVTGLVKPLWYVSATSYTLKNMTMVDTDVALAGGTNIIDLGKTTSLGNESVTIKNCILYGASNYVSRIVNNSSQNLSAWTSDVVFENNTVYNLHPGTNNGLLHMAGANSVVFNNNLVSFFSLNATEYVIRIWKNTPTYTVENNHFWSRHYIEGVQQLPEDVTLYGTTKITWAAANITSGAYPFTSTVPGAGATR